VIEIIASDGKREVARAYPRRNSVLKRTVTIPKEDGYRALSATAGVALGCDGDVQFLVSVEISSNDPSCSGSPNGISNRSLKRTVSVAEQNAY